MEINLTGKTVLVTGGSRGIGAEISREFASAGAKIILQYNTNEEIANKVISKLFGRGHFAIKANFENTNETEKLFKEISEKFRVDILINNAGIIEVLDPMTCSFEEWRKNWEKTISINLSSSAHLCFLFGKQMAKNGGGKIINISSRGAFRGEPNAPAYGASKAGMNAMGQSFAKAFGSKNVFFYTIAPGFVETDMSEKILNSSTGVEIKAQSPLNRVAMPWEVARAALLMAAEGTDFMTGCIIDLNGASYLRT
ncbi:MAG: SDR family oxidoreductase [Bacteroidales bacterium]|nr:SDR family oxidoreductase [Bacteroidales bacterium]